MEFEYQQTFEYQVDGNAPRIAIHRLTIKNGSGKILPGPWAPRDRTPTIDYGGRRYAWIGARVVSIDPVGIKCSTEHCTVTVVGNTYCQNCAEKLRARKLCPACRHPGKHESHEEEYLHNGRNKKCRCSNRSCRKHPKFPRELFVRTTTKETISTEAARAKIEELINNLSPEQKERLSKELRG